MSLSDSLATLSNAIKGLNTKLYSHTTDIARSVVAGSRGQDVQFSTLLSREMTPSRKNASGSYSNPSQLMGSPVVRSFAFDFTTQGDAIIGKDHHLYLENPGTMFILSKKHKGKAYYTKAGNFDLTEGGELRSLNGLSLMGYALYNGQRSSVLSEISIGNFTEPKWDVNGTLSALNTAGSRVELYQVAVTSFPNMPGLQTVDGGVTFEESLASGTPYTTGSPGPQYGLVRPAAHEASNIDSNAETIEGTLPTERFLQAQTSAIQAIMKVWDDTMQKLTS